MSSTPTAASVLDRVYLEVRCKLLDISACLDRIDRAEASGDVSGDPRLAQIREAISILNSDGPDRAERVQMLFSDAYVAGWNRRDKAGKNGR